MTLRCQRCGSPLQPMQVFCVPCGTPTGIRVQYKKSGVGCIGLVIVLVLVGCTIGGFILFLILTH
jgi:uncharacterized OB-fold protein